MFTVNLKKAHLIQQDIANIIEGIIIHNSVTINEFQIAEVVVDTNKEILKAKIFKKSTLIEVRYKIRDLIAKANHNSGIGSNLTEIIALNKKIGILEPLIKSTPEIPVKYSELQEKLLKIKRLESSYEDNIHTAILSIEDAHELKEDLYELKRRKSSLSDEVSAANVTTLITIPDDIVSILKEERII